METGESEPWEKIPESSDLEIIIGDSIIKCHKVMLQFRSPVFRSMFDVNMVENNTNKLTIKDIDEKTFLIFLRHLYLPEKLLRDEDLSLDLLYVADKYMVRSLVDIFNNHSEKFVTIDNAIKCARVASRSDSPWRYKILSFIAQHYKKIKDSENLKDLIEDVDFTIDLLYKMDLRSHSGKRPHIFAYVKKFSDVKISLSVVLAKFSVSHHTMM